MKSVILTTMLLLGTATQAQTQQCPLGYQPYANRCVTQPMADYISCVEASGGNHQELKNAIASAAESRKTSGGNVGVDVKLGKGNGAIVLGSNAETKLVENLESRWFPNGMSECAQVLGTQKKEPAKKQVSAQPHKPKLPMRVEIKSAPFEFFPGLTLTTIAYWAGSEGGVVVLESPSFGKLRLNVGDRPTTISASNRHYTIHAEGITNAGVALVLDELRQ